MSASEKRFFKIYCSRQAASTEKNYLRLFDAMDRQKIYNENVLTDQFKGEGFTRQFSVAKNYLHNLLLESLEAYHSSASAGQEVRHLLSRIELLYDKNLFAQALKLVKKGRKIAEAHGMYLQGLELIQWEERMMTQITTSSQGNKRSGILQQRRKEMIAQYAHDSGYTHLAKELVWLLNKHGAATSAGDLQKYRPIFEHPLMRDPSKAATIGARIAYYNARGFYHLMNGQPESAYENYRIIVELTEDQPEKVAENTTTLLSRYVSFCTNFLSVAISLRRFDAYFDKTLQNMRAFPEKLANGKALPENVSLLILVNYHSILLRKCAVTAEFERGQKVIREIAAELAAAAASTTRIMTEPWLSMAQLCFGAGKYEDALGWLNKILNHPQAAISRQDIYAWAKIFALIIHYELKHEEVLEYHIKSAYRYLVRSARLHPAEQLMLHFFKKEMPKVHSEKALLKAFSSLHQKLQNLSSRLDEYKYLHLLSWLESRINRRPLPEIVKEKALKQV